MQIKSYSQSNINKYFSSKKFISRRNNHFFWLVLLYKIALEIIYVNILSPTYSYMYLTTNISIQKLIFSTVAFLFTIKMIVKTKDSVSKNIIIVLYLFIFVPTISYYWLNNQSTLYSLFLTLSFILIIYTSRLRFPRKEKIGHFKEKNIVLFCFLIFVFSMIFLIYLRGGIDIRALSFKSIYSLREEENIFGFAGYLKNWLPKVLFPLLFGYFVIKKKKFWLAITIVFEILLYLSFGNKAFLLCVGWAIICLFSSKKRYFPIWISAIMLTIVCLSGLLSYFRVSDSLRDAIPYRLLFVPSQIQYQYYDYFSVNEKMLFSEGWIGKMFGLVNPYGEDVAFMIHRINSPNGGVSHSNTCFLADAYYNLGFGGMLLISCLSGMFLSLYNRFTKLSSTLVLVSVSYIIFSFADTGFQTTLLTGGMLMNYLLLYMLNSSYKTNSRCFHVLKRGCM